MILMNRYQEQKARWDQLVDWDWYKYTTATMYKRDY